MATLLAAITSGQAQTNSRLDVRLAEHMRTSLAPSARRRRKQSQSYRRPTPTPRGRPSPPAMTRHRPAWRRLKRELPALPRYHRHNHPRHTTKWCDGWRRLKLPCADRGTDRRPRTWAPGQRPRAARQQDPHYVDPTMVRAFSTGHLPRTAIESAVDYYAAKEALNRETIAVKGPRVRRPDAQK